MKPLIWKLVAILVAIEAVILGGGFVTITIFARSRDWSQAGLAAIGILFPLLIPLLVAEFALLCYGPIALNVVLKRDVGRGGEAVGQMTVTATGPSRTAENFYYIFGFAIPLWSGLHYVKAFIASEFGWYFLIGVVPGLVSFWVSLALIRRRYPFRFQSKKVALAALASIAAVLFA